MNQPSENRPTYPPFDPPPDNPPAPPPSASSPFSAKPPPPPRRPRWSARLLIVLFIVALVGPLAAILGPREIAAWHLVAAQEQRAAGQNTTAYDRLANAIRWSPKQPGLLLQRAVWRLEDGQTEAALTDVNLAEELARDHYLVLSIRSQVLQHLDRHAEAIEDWKTIDRLSQTRGTPHRATALNGLAYARAVGKLDLKEANQNVAEALKLVPNNPSILDTRGYLLHLQGLNEAALVDMDTAVKGMEADFAAIHGSETQPPSDVDLSGLNKPEQGVAVVRYHRALVLQALGRSKDAEKDLQRARELIGREPDEKLF